MDFEKNGFKITKICRQTFTLKRWNIFGSDIYKNYLNIVLEETKHQNKKIPRPSNLHFATRWPLSRVRSSDGSQHPWDLDSFSDLVGFFSPLYMHQMEIEWHNDTLEYSEKKLEIEEKIKERP